MLPRFFIPVSRQSAGRDACSDFMYAVSIGYTKDVSHWASSSSANAACTVEPGTAEDVGTIVSVI